MSRDPAQRRQRDLFARQSPGPDLGRRGANRRLRRAVQQQAEPQQAHEVRGQAGQVPVLVLSAAVRVRVIVSRGRCFSITSTSTVASD
jgi:hypothetical protein